MSYMVSDLGAQVSNGELEDAVTATLSDSKAYTDIKFITLQGALATKADLSLVSNVNNAIGIRFKSKCISNIKHK